MTRTEYENMSFDDLMLWAYDNLDDITDEEMLKECGIKQLNKMEKKREVFVLVRKRWCLST